MSVIALGQRDKLNDKYLETKWPLSATRAARLIRRPNKA
jgi:hypothetical protein